WGGELDSSLYRLLGGRTRADWSSLRWRSFLRAVRRTGARWRLCSARTAGSGIQMAGTSSRRESQYPGVDAVGLAGEWRQPLHLRRVGDLDLPALQLEPVVDERGAGHRLDRRSHRLSMASKPGGQTAQTVAVGRCRADVDRRAG